MTYLTFYTFKAAFAFLFDSSQSRRTRSIVTPRHRTAYFSLMTHAGPTGIQLPFLTILPSNYSLSIPLLWKNYISKFQSLWISIFQGFWISIFQCIRISIFQDFRIFRFWDFKVSGIQYFKVSGFQYFNNSIFLDFNNLTFPDCKICRSLDSKISRFLNFNVPRNNFLISKILWNSVKVFNLQFTVF